ncbi:hypothetical protein ALI144C_16955 [Actinosynnema sp. ALI-1.44]|uniref:Imm1 family immunity protein n=1 Tax=Actinosynnema sp. ALI-1.44 TaxID=1933779 RepID=UPI00097C5788|nr:Imm1 family immunity protein [Actinosynnema sp. ALI-1.44]ONI83185.1 hypothetical protein ALI144C_16955 [Actinosynnema sp. ALI-1.44]
MIVQTESELRDALDEFARFSQAAPMLAQVSPDVDKPLTALTVGMHGARGVLYYAGADSADGVYSKGDGPEDGQELLYYYMDSDTPFPANSEIPAEAVRTAAQEFMSAGQCPSVVQWQPRPVPTGPDESQWPM